MTVPDVTRIEFPGVHLPILHGVALDLTHGRVSLARLPELPALDPPVPPTEWALRGVAATADGRVYWVSRDGRSILLRGCDGSTSRFGCAPGIGAEMAGLAVGRHELYVSMPNRSSVASFDLSDGRLVSVWSGLDSPSDLVVDGDDVYVATDVGVAALLPGGSSLPVVTRDGVRSVTIAVFDDRTRALIIAIDGEPATLEAYGLDGSPISDAPIPNHAEAASRVLVRADGRHLAVAAPDLGSISVWDLFTASWLGTLPGGPVTIAGLDGASTWWIGDGHTVGATGAERWVDRGRVRVTSIEIPVDPDGGIRRLVRVKLRGRLADVVTRTHLQFWRRDGMPLTTDRPTDPLSADRLLSIPAGAATLDVEVELSDPPVAADDPATRHWLDAIELRYDEAGIIEQLPAIYRSEGEPSDFLDPYLRLLTSGNDDVVDALVDLPEQFDPATAVDDLDGDRWLDWLASWVDARIDETWPSAVRRRVVAEAFERHGRRGTPEAIRDRISLEFGITAEIFEPGDISSIWVLGDDDAELGMTAMLADAPAAGSVVDVTAVVDRSHLIGPGEIGAPLFGDLAHRFHVVVHAGAVPDHLVDELTAVIERERPAHTRAHLCRVEPGFHLGLGGRIGVDLALGPPTGTLGGLDGFADDGRRPRLGDPFPEPLVLT